MNVFSDFHHSGLLNSLIMLFEGRLGGQLYRPIGTEWHELGYWKVYDHPATVLQYLGINGATPDGTPILNEVIQKQGFVYQCNDIDSGLTNKAITHEGFMSMDFSYIVASIPEHIEPFRRLANSHPSKPKLIYQIGNAWELTLEQRSLLDGVMSSAKLPIIWDVSGYNGKPLPMVEYHQEFDLSVFKPSESQELPLYTIYSFVNCFNLQDHFASDWWLFQEMEKMMSPFWTFKSFGGGCRDGAAHGTKQVADKMRESRFIWHTKNGGDGYGHVIYNSAAVGKPLITKRKYYQGKMGEELMIDGVTCIDISELTPGEIKEKIVHYAETEPYLDMCNQVRENFNSRVHFDQEAEQIRQFLANLI